MTALSIAGIVVTYNRPEHLRLTVERLLAEPVDYVIVVDNCSTIEFGPWIDEIGDQRFQIHRLPENRGGAGGFEAGLQIAESIEGLDWAVLMDDDARPEAGAIAAFQAGLDTESTQIGAAAAAVFHPDGTVSEMNRPSRNPFWHLPVFLRALSGGGDRSAFHVSDADLQSDAPGRAIDVASFVGFFVSMPAVRTAGLPEGGLFIYGDDVLYSLRLRRAGFDLQLLPSVRFEHDCETMGEGYIYRPLWKIYYHCRNGVSIAWHAGGPILFPAVICYYIRVWWLRGRHYEADERKLFRRMLWKGVWDGFLGRRGYEHAVHEWSAAASGRDHPGA